MQQKLVRPCRLLEEAFLVGVTKLLKIGLLEEWLVIGIHTLST